MTFLPSNSCYGAFLLTNSNYADCYPFVYYYKKLQRRVRFGFYIGLLYRIVAFSLSNLFVLHSRIGQGGFFMNGFFY